MPNLPLQSIQESEKNEIVEMLKYFAWVDSSGIHGKERHQAYADFLGGRLRTSFISLIQAQIIELKGRMKQCSMKSMNNPCPECYELRKLDDWNSALSQTISLYQNLITDLQK